MNQQWLDDFKKNGYATLKNAASAQELRKLNAAVDGALQPALAPVEFEADVGYPGAPLIDDPEGGRTPRRLLHAYTRDQAFRQWGRNPKIIAPLGALLKDTQILLSQNHHNCIMTKNPRFSTRTAWHRDLRYWSFDRPELISVWLALGSEREENGALYVIPASHREKFGRGSYDSELFFREDLAENQRVLERAISVPLDAGDVLFFDALTLHAAGVNTTSITKRSLVFTYHAQSNQAIPNTKSARFSDIPV